MCSKWSFVQINKVGSPTPRNAMPKQKIKYSIDVLEQRDLSIVTVPLYQERDAEAKK